MKETSADEAKNLPRYRHLPETELADLIDDMPDGGIELAPKNHEQEAKPDASLLPMDLLVKYVCPAYAEGLVKYYRNSWRKGFYVSVMIAAALRHITAFFWGNEDYDPDAEALGVKKHHLGAAIWCLLAILHTLDTRPELDDREAR